MALLPPITTLAVPATSRLLGTRLTTRMPPVLSAVRPYWSTERTQSITVCAGGQRRRAGEVQRPRPSAGGELGNCSRASTLRSTTPRCSKSSLAGQLPSWHPISPGDGFGVVLLVVCELTVRVAGGTVSTTPHRLPALYWQRAGCVAAVRTVTLYVPSGMVVEVVSVQCPGAVAGKLRTGRERVSRTVNGHGQEDGSHRGLFGPMFRSGWADCCA